MGKAGSNISHESNTSVPTWLHTRHMGWGLIHRRWGFVDPPGRRKRPHPSSPQPPPLRGKAGFFGTWLLGGDWTTACEKHAGEEYGPAEGLDYPETTLYSKEAGKASGSGVQQVTCEDQHIGPKKVYCLDACHAGLAANEFPPRIDGNADYCQHSQCVQRNNHGQPSARIDDACAWC